MNFRLVCCFAWLAAGCGSYDSGPVAPVPSHLLAIDYSHPSGAAGSVSAPAAGNGGGAACGPGLKTGRSDEVVMVGGIARSFLATDGFSAMAAVRSLHRSRPSKADSASTTVTARPMGK